MVWALNCHDAPDALAKLVLLGLANHADATGGNAWASAQTLADYADCSRRSVIRKLKELEAVGLIVRGDQRLVAHLRGDRRPIVWDIVTDGLFAPTLKPRGDNLSPRKPVDNPTDGVTAVSPRDDHGVTGWASRGDTAVTQTVLEPIPPLPPVIGCSRHTVPDERCRACRSAQDAEGQRLAHRQAVVERAARNRIVQSEIDRCGMCNEYGNLPNGLPCLHDPAASDRARRNAGRVREMMGWDKSSNKGVGVETAYTPGMCIDTPGSNTHTYSPTACGWPGSTVEEAS